MTTIPTEFWFNVWGRLTPGGVPTGQIWINQDPHLTERAALEEIGDGFDYGSRYLRTIHIETGIEARDPWHTYGGFDLSEEAAELRRQEKTEAAADEKHEGIERRAYLDGQL